MKTIGYKLTGIAPLLMHSARLADPTDKFARELKRLSSTKKKTDSIFEDMAKIEWRGGLYTSSDDDDGVVVIPGDVIFSTIVAGARKLRLGKDAESAVFPMEPYFPLEHDGPKRIQKLSEDMRFRDRRGVRIQRNRIIRVRPIFPSWSLTISLGLIEDVLDPVRLTDAVIAAGQVVGLCDYRPRFGRFSVESL